MSTDKEHIIADSKWYDSAVTRHYKLAGPRNPYDIRKGRKYMVLVRDFDEDYNPVDKYHPCRYTGYWMTIYHATDTTPANDVIVMECVDEPRLLYVRPSQVIPYAKWKKEVEVLHEGRTK